jgi:hypothetical protein
MNKTFSCWSIQDDLSYKSNHRFDLDRISDFIYKSFWKNVHDQVCDLFYKLNYRFSLDSSSGTIYKTDIQKLI